YELIGSVYAQVERKEPWCTRAEAVTEIAVLTPEAHLGKKDARPALYGVSRMLQETGYQFDIIDDMGVFDRYKVIILPDRVPVIEEVAAKLQAYMNNGGAVLASFESGMDAAGERFVLSELGVQLRPHQLTDTNGHKVRGKHYNRNDFAEYLVPEPAISNGLAITEHVMYMKGVEVIADRGSEVWAYTVKSYFNRSY